MFNISHSKAKLARRCLKAYQYRYIDKIRKRVKSMPLTIGSLVHSCLETWFLGEDYEQEIDNWIKNEYNKMFKEERVEFEDVPNLVRGMMEGYEQFWEDQGLEMVWVETEFELEIADGIQLIGKIDGIAEDNRGRCWTVEHKTAEKMPGEELRMYDTQVVLYAGVAAELDFPKQTGVIWDYLRKRLPAKPQVLKGGGLSTAARQDTTYEVFMQTLKEMKLSPKGYEDYLETLKEKRNNFFRHVKMPVNKNMITGVRNDIIITSNRLIELEERGDRWDRNITRDCSWCDYRTLCLAELKGEDTSHLLKFDFVRSKHGNKTKKKVRRDSR